MRIMTGAFKTTPIRAIEEISPLASIYEGSEVKIIPQVAKIEALNSKLHNTGKKNRLKRTHFIQEAKNLKKKYQIENIAIETVKQYNDLPPWDTSRLPSITVSLGNVKKKSEYDQKELKETVITLLNELYPNSNWVRVYTDGSFDEATKKGGAGILIEWPNGERLEKSSATSRLSDSFKAESAALELAATTLLNHPHTPNSRIVLLTDAMTVLQALQESTTKRTESLKTVLTNLNKISRETALQWIPSHTQIEGNDTADKLAKLGSRSQQPESPLHPEEVKKIIATSINQRWTKAHPKYNKNDAYYKLSR